MNEPSMGEVMQRLNDVAARLADLARQMSDDRRDTAAAYVRKDVYDVAHRTLAEDVRNLELSAKEREKVAADTRRQFMFLVLALALPAIAGLLLAVNNFLAYGGV